MSTKTAQFANDQEVLLSVGPFGGLDTTSSPVYVAPINATQLSNYTVNRTYGSLTTAQGRVANYLNYTFASTPQAIGFTTIGASAGTTYYVPTVLAAFGTTLAVISPTQAPTFVTLPVSLETSHSSRFVYAGSYAFTDSGVNMLGEANLITLTNNVFVPVSASLWGIIGPTTAPTVGTSAGGNLTGTYYYAVTYVGQNLGAYTSVVVAVPESSPTPFSAAVTGTNVQINVTNIPVSSDPQVVNKNIYRMGGTIGGTPLLVGTVANAVTAYTDNLADSAVTGYQLVLRRDPAPGWQSIAHHKGRMWGFGTYSLNGNSSDLWYSNYLDYTGFNSVTQVIDCGNNNEGDVAVAIESLDSIMLAFKLKSTYIIYGDTGNDFISRPAFSVGCVVRGSVASGYGSAFWLSADGVYTFSLDAGLKNISDGSPQAGSIRSVVDVILNTVAGTPGFSVRGFVINRTYCMSVSFGANDSRNITYVYDTLSGLWTTLPYAGYSILGYRSYAGNTNGPLGGSIVLAASETRPGQIDQWYAAETDLGSAIVGTWVSAVFDNNVPEKTKQYRYLEIQSPVAAGTVLTVSLTVNQGTTSYTTPARVIDLSANVSVHRIAFPPNTNGHSAQLNISTSSTAKTIIQKILVYGYVKRQFSPSA
jgi:hypothetical protein